MAMGNGAAAPSLSAALLCGSPSSHCLKTPGMVIMIVWAARDHGHCPD